MKFRKPKIKIEIGKYYYVDFKDSRYGKIYHFTGIVLVESVACISGLYYYNYRECYNIKRFNRASPCFKEWLPRECFIKEIKSSDINGNVTLYFPK